MGRRPRPRGSTGASLSAHAIFFVTFAVPCGLLAARHLPCRRREQQNSNAAAKNSETSVSAGTNPPQFRWLCRRGHHVVTPAPGGVPPPPTEAVRRTNFSGRIFHNRSTNVSHADSASALSHTHVSFANHSWTRSQTGHFTREKNTGERRNSDVSISMPVGISRPVCGHRIMIAPIPNLPGRSRPGRQIAVLCEYCLTAGRPLCGNSINVEIAGDVSGGF